MSIQLPPEINENASQIIAALDPESIDVYQFLSERYLASDLATDTVYQFVFRSFYRLDNAGLTPEFKRRFFELMRDAKVAGVADIASLVEELRRFPNRKGQSSLQFSFATKLAATVNSHAPIYDAEVASLFGFRAPYTYKSFEKRLAEYLAFYEDLKQLYEKIIIDNQLRSARDLFRSRFGCDEMQVSEYKALDFIFWAAGKQSREVADK